MIARRIAGPVAAAAMLALVPATAAQADHECQPNKIGTVIYYQSPNGWVTIHIPVCIGPD